MQTNDPYFLIYLSEARPVNSRSSTPVQDDNKDRDYRPGPSVSSAIIVPTHSDYHNRERPPPRPRCRDYDGKIYHMLQ